MHQPGERRGRSLPGWPCSGSLTLPDIDAVCQTRERLFSGVRVNRSHAAEITVFTACSRSNASAPRSLPAMHWTRHHNVCAHARTCWRAARRQRALLASRMSKRFLDRRHPICVWNPAAPFNNVVARFPCRNLWLTSGEMTVRVVASKIRSRRLLFRVRPSAKAATASSLSPFPPISLNCHELERAGRVKGGAAAERSEDTLDAPEHSNRLAKGNGCSDFVSKTGGPFSRALRSNSFVIWPRQITHSF